MSTDPPPDGVAHTPPVARSAHVPRSALRSSASATSVSSTAATAQPATQQHEQHEQQQQQQHSRRSVAWTATTTAAAPNADADRTLSTSAAAVDGSSDAVAGVHGVQLAHAGALSAAAGASEGSGGDDDAMGMPRMSAVSLSEMAALKELSRNMLDTLAEPYLVTWQTMQMAEIAERLHTDVANGLSAAEAARRLKIVGLNRLKESGRVHPVLLFIKHLFDLMLLLLLVASVVSFAFGEYVEAAVVLGIVLCNGTIGFVQEYRAEKTLEALQQLAAGRVQVVRGGKTREILATHVVPGDIVLLFATGAGSTVAADMRLVDAEGLEIDESTLTGENRPVSKTAMPSVLTPGAPAGRRMRFFPNTAYSGCFVTRGTGRGIVLSTGMNTVLGSIAAKVTDGRRKARTQLQAEMHRLALVLFVIGVVLGIVVFAANRFNINNPSELPHTALYAIALIVGLIPEELPVVLTLTMALGVRRMAQRNVIVRQLTALEQLGRVTDICSDKTGTITQARMSVTHMMLDGDRAFRVTDDAPSAPVRDEGATSAAAPGVAARPRGGAGLIVTGSLLPLVQQRASDAAVTSLDSTVVRADAQLSLAMQVCALCNSATLEQDVRTGEWRGIGQATDVAVQVLAGKFGLGKRELLADRFQVSVELPFESAVKSMSVVVVPHASIAGEAGDEFTHDALQFEGRQSAFMKGAPERVAQCCSRVMRSDGTVERITAVALRKLLAHSEAVLNSNGAVLAAAPVRDADGGRGAGDGGAGAVVGEPLGLRILALACRGACVGDSPERFTCLASSATVDRDNVERDMVFLGVLGIRDPPRPGVQAAVAECVQGGVTVRMLTGDHVTTAASIASEVGIIGGAIPVVLSAAAPMPEVAATPSSSRADLAGQLRGSTAGGALSMLAAATRAGRVMDASVFDVLQPGELDSLVELPRVVARCTPDSKVRMMQALHDRSRIVAMTGDGVNDAPALRAADIGVAMGKSGSGVTRQTAHIVLADDNFVSIVAAVREGRRMFLAIKKFTAHLLTSNVAMTLLLMVGLAFRDASDLVVFPLSPVEVLWVNLCVVSLPAFGLAGEAPDEDVMAAPPAAKLTVFTRDVVLDTLVYGFLVGALAIGTFASVLYGVHAGIIGEHCNSGDATAAGCVFVQRARSATFMAVSLMLLVNSYNCRDPEHFLWHRFRERPLNRVQLVASLISIGTVFLFVYTPVLNIYVFQHVGIDVEWGVVFAAGLAYLVLSHVWKLVRPYALRAPHERAARVADTFERFALPRAVPSAPRALAAAPPAAVGASRV